MKSLDEIMIGCESDKASQFTRTYAQPHNYCIHLEHFFAPIRNEPIKLLEIGTGGGESMRGWLEYFPNARIYGVDIVSNTNEWNTPGAKPHERYTFACGDQSKPEFWKKFIEVSGGDWDVICDDGSHVDSDISTTFNFMWNHVAPGGIYDIEDLSVSPEAREWLRWLVPNAIAGDKDIDFIYFARELAILKKR